MGYCSYQRNASELYRDTKPGQAPETICGARTWPAVDEPEVVVVRTGMTSDGAVYEYRPTGRSVPRSQHDPYCPRHGGSPEPPPPPVSMYELEQAWAAYQDLSQRYQGQPGGALTAPAAPPAQLAAASADAPAPAHAPAPAVTMAAAPAAGTAAPYLAPAAVTAAAAPAGPPGYWVTGEDLAAAEAAYSDLAARAQAEAGQS